MGGPPSMRLVVAVLQAGVMAMVASMLSALIILVENGAGSAVFQNQQQSPQLLRVAPPHTPPPAKPVLRKQQPLLRLDAWVMTPGVGTAAIGGATNSPNRELIAGGRVTPIA